MDDIKDIKKTDQLARFLDGQAIRTRPFGRNIFGEKAYHRAERLVSAMHLLTNHIPENEPVRHSVRKGGIKLLECMLILRDEMRAQNSIKTINIQSSIRELISLVRLLAVSGFISIQNAEIVTGALDELGNYLNASQRSVLSENVLLSRENLAEWSDMRIAKNTVSASVKFHPGQAGTNTADVKDSKDITDKDIVVEKVSIRHGRSQSILDILGSNQGELGIKDISGQLPEYSEKMVQRGLADLVAAGKVKKSGFKRWSKYALA